MHNHYSCGQCGYWADVNGDGWPTCPWCGGNDTTVEPVETPAPAPVTPETPPAAGEGAA